MIFAAGSRGDVQPCAALGRALAARGHHVRLVASGRYAPSPSPPGSTWRRSPPTPPRSSTRTRARNCSPGAATPSRSSAASGASSAPWPNGC
ncbi:glycosyltransferase [Actinomadura keratinilytica]|uniref:glycosyltransferase n=1 Tax=Actinomadura keratinilytica TaxID=547461 RepID=UPI0036233127